LANMAAAAPLPALLTIKTVKAAAAIAAGKALATSCVSAHAMALAQEALFGLQIKVVAALLAVGLTVAGVGWAGVCGFRAELQPLPRATAQPPVREDQIGGNLKKDISFDQYGDPLPQGALARLGTMRLRHHEQVRGVAFSPGGKILASISMDEAIHLWDST